MNRRQVLALVITGVLGGCDSDTGGTDCTASPPTAAPTDHSAAREYPTPPDAVSPDSLGRFAEAYERAYQYNTAVQNYPRLIGRTNELTVSVEEVSTSRTLSGPEASVSGEVVYTQASGPRTVDGERLSPLPTAHLPFDIDYTTGDGRVYRDGDAVACLE